MDSTAYNPAPVSYGKKKKPSAAAAIVLIILGLLLAVGNICATVSLLSKQPEAPVVMEDTSYALMTIQEDYHIDLMVIDYLATMQENNVDKEDYFLALFMDGDGDPYYCVLRTEKDTDLYNELQEYIMDETQLIGDAMYDAYYSVHNISSVTDLKDEFDEGIEEYDELISTEFGYVGRSIYYLEYICGADEDYFAVMKSQSKGGAAFTGLMSVIGLVLLLVGVLKMVKAKKNKDVQPQVQTIDQYPQQTYTPPQQTYTPPQQTYTPPQQGEYPPAEDPCQPTAQPLQSSEPDDASDDTDGTI